MPYSLKNRSTNTELPISTLKPLINSLSPSKRSNGARLLSIKEIVNHNVLQMKNTSILTKVLLKKNLFKNLRTNKNTTIRATSKDNL